MIRLLRYLTGTALAESIAGDLDAERRRRAIGAPIAARLWWCGAFARVVLFVAKCAALDMARELGRTITRRLSSLSEWRHAFRSLRRSPWYSLTVTSVIALGMALATTVFAIVDGVLFKPLPYPGVSQLSVVGGPHGYLSSIRDVREWAAALPTAEFAAFTMPFDVGAVGDRPARIRGARVDRHFFSVLGTQPLIGGFSPGQFEPSPGPVPALITYALWQREFGGRVDAIGRPLDLAGATDHLGRALPSLDVAGVLPPNFVYPYARDPPDVLLPIALTPLLEFDRNASLAVALMRRPDGVPLNDIRDRLDRVAATQSFPEAEPGPGRGRDGVSVISVDTLLRQGQTASFRVAFWMAATIVLIVSVNVAGLGVARLRQRRGEYALRRALGADAWALTRLTLAEVAPLVAAGTLAGLVATPALLHTMVRMLPSTVLLLETPAIDLRVLTFSGLTAVLTLMLVAIVERVTMSPVAFGAAMGRGETSTDRRGLRVGVMIGLQVALTTLLVVGGSLMVGSAWLVWRQSPGFDPSHAVVLEVGPPAGVAGVRNASLRELMAECRTVLGVDSVGLLDAPFLENGQRAPGIRRPASAGPGREQALPVSGDFFRAMGLSPLEGRLPTATELDTRAPVAVVSERAARQLWPNANPLGQTLRSANNLVDWLIVGVVPDVRYVSLDTAPIGQIYTPSDGWPTPSLVVRGHIDGTALLSALLTQLRSSSSRHQLIRAATLEDALGDSIRLRTFRAWLFGGFAGAALLVLAVGVLGQVAMITAERTREFGIRLALGATRDRVIGLSLREPLVSVVVGLLAGSLVALWTVRSLEHYLFLFTPYDAHLWAAAILTVLMTTLAGAIVPALRASSVDPIGVLRE